MLVIIIVIAGNYQQIKDLELKLNPSMLEIM